MQDFIWLFWDIAAVILIITCIYKGVKYGFVRMAVSIACYVISALAAERYSPVLAQTVYHQSIEAPLRLSITERLEEALVQGLDTSSLIQSFPKWMQALAATLSDPEILENLNLNVGAGQIADIVVDEVLYEPVIWLLQGILFLVIFTALTWVIHRFARIFSGIYKIPVIGTINCFLGGVLGIAQGMVLLLVAGIAVQLLITLLGGTMWMNPDIIDSTYIFRVFYGQIMQGIP